MVELSHPCPSCLVLAFAGCFRIKLVRKAMRERGLPIYRTKAGTWETTTLRRNVVITASQPERRVKLDSALESRNGGKDPIVIAKSDQVKQSSFSRSWKPVPRAGGTVDDTHLHSSMEGAPSPFIAGTLSRKGRVHQGFRWPRPSCIPTSFPSAPCLTGAESGAAGNRWFLAKPHAMPKIQKEHSQMRFLA